MTRFVLNLTVLWVLVTCSGKAEAGEYEDADILPKVTALTFGEDAVSIQFKAGRYHRKQPPSFELKRSSGELLPAPNLANKSLLNPESLETASSEYQSRSGALRTDDGKSYEPYRCTLADDYRTKMETPMTIDGIPFPTHFEKCISVSQVQIVGDLVWMGTYHESSHGDWGGVGLIVARKDSGDIAARINTGKYPITRVAYDSTTTHIWAVTWDRIFVVNQQMNVVEKYFLYYDFDRKTGYPALMFARKVTRSHPLAVFALHLPETLYETFFHTVQKLPDGIARNFSLYEFYMCCTGLNNEGALQHSKELEVLVPFLLPAFERSLERLVPDHRHLSKNASRTWSRIWRQVACNYRQNPEAKRLCETEDWAELTGSHKSR
ncbi:MAG: hypothetical protein AAFO81_13900 [Pseudomonadota bacterium]